MGAEKDTGSFDQLAIEEGVNTILAAKENFKIIPNSTQHNVPAWTIFALFFMVISLGSNVVKEKVSGSFVRLKMFPGSFKTVLIGKTLLFLFIGILQIIFLLLIGVFLLPILGLPQLIIPSNLIALFFFSLLVSLSAVTFSIAVGSLAKTQEQSNGMGAVLIMIFAAIGGIWIPVFVMNETMQGLAKISPFYWCLDGFYGLFYFFLKNPKPLDKLETTFLVPKKFEYLVPKSWENNILLYSFDYLQNNETDRTVLYGTVTSDVFLMKT